MKACVDTTLAGGWVQHFPQEVFSVVMLSSGVPSKSQSLVGVDWVIGSLALEGIKVALMKTLSCQNRVATQKPEFLDCSLVK